MDYQRAETVMQSNDQGADAHSVASSQKKTNWPGILSLIGGMSLMLYLGCFFLWGNISIYVLSYFHEYAPDASYDFIFLVDSMLILANWTGY